MYLHIHVYIYAYENSCWFVCLMCQTYWAHVFLIGCASHPVTACSQLGSSVRLPTLFPTLVALLPALAYSAVLVCTHWNASVPVLSNCGATKMFLLNQYVDPAASLRTMRGPRFFENKRFTTCLDPARLLKRAGSKNV